VNGNWFTVMMDGESVTVCVIGCYENEEGEETALLAVIRPENMLHVPKRQLDYLFQSHDPLH